MKKCQNSCLCACLRATAMNGRDWAEKSLTILSPSTCEEWIATEWQITVCLPYCPRHTRHVTPSPPRMAACLPASVHVCVCAHDESIWPLAIIAFRLVTGRICIHSGWDLFLREVAGKSFRRTDGTFFGQNIYSYTYDFRSYLLRCPLVKCRDKDSSHREEADFFFSAVRLQ